MIRNSVAIFSLLAVVNSAKILVVVPTPSISHQVVFRPLIQELINRDHEVILITADPVCSPDNSPKNLSEIDVHDLSYNMWNEVLTNLGKENQTDILFVMTVVFRELSRIFEKQLKYEPVQKLIKDETVKFDLLILEACIAPALIFSHIFKAPVIQMSSFGAIPGNMETIGAETHPFLYPTHYHQNLYNLTTWEKITELYYHIAFKRMLQKQDANDNIMLQNIFGVDVPPLSELKNNIDMLFLNVHPIWLHNQPVPPNVVFTWGIHKMPEKPLPKDLQDYLDSSKEGLIYVSFGTNVKSSTISPEKLEILLQVFSQLPFNILLKWDMDDLPGKSDNIKISKWLPQVDVLKHPNLKLFITQGGLQSTDEAINAGVPMIGIPMFADQRYNTEKYEYFKIGLKLEFESLSSENLKAAIMCILADYERYRKNVLNLRTQMQDQPMPPLENAMWWIEYILRHGGAKHFRSPAANMAWTEYYELKLVVVMLIGLIVIGSMLLLTANEPTVGFSTLPDYGPVVLFHNSGGRNCGRCYCGCGYLPQAWQVMVANGEDAN